MRRRSPPVPQAIDDATGFKVDHASLKRQWDGAMTVNPDQRHPQDMVRARADISILPNPRPEAADVFLTTDMLWEDGITPIMHEISGPITLEATVAVILP